MHANESRMQIYTYTQKYLDDIGLLVDQLFQSPRRDMGKDADASYYLKDSQVRIATK